MSRTEIGSTQTPGRLDTINERKVYVVDAMMGLGKTSASITYVNRAESGERFFFLTPYVREGERIRNACPEKQFVVLEKRRGSKLNDLRHHVNQGHNIASTHALLEHYTPDILEQIVHYQYTLILDEAYDVTQPVSETSKKNFQLMLEMGAITVDPRSRQVTLNGHTTGEFEGTSFQELADKIATGGVYYYDNKLLIWVFPIQILQAFKRIIILTHLFEAQPISHYLALNNFSFEYWGTRKTGEQQYEFCPMAVRDRPSAELKSKIVILDHAKLNEIGDSQSALCSRWYSRMAKMDNGKTLEKLGKNIRNAQKNIYKCSTYDFMWTTYKRYKDSFADKNIAKHYVPCNEKATNMWGTRHYLAYCVNFYENPDAYSYFKKFGRELDVDRWALSEMLQWIWRSAIRNGEDIYIYIPSSRMRRLLEDWLNEVSAAADEAA